MGLTQSQHCCCGPSSPPSCAREGWQGLARKGTLCHMSRAELDNSCLPQAIQFKVYEQWRPTVCMCHHIYTVPVHSCLMHHMLPACVHTTTASPHVSIQLSKASRKGVCMSPQSNHQNVLSRHDEDVHANPAIYPLTTPTHTYKLHDRGYRPLL